MFPPPCGTPTERVSAGVLRVCLRGLHTGTVPVCIGSDIKGTTYDAAYVNWGNDWRMPTEKEMGELVSKCTFKEETHNGVDGYLVTGPNGSSVFFPSAGVMKDKKEVGCRYWTSTVYLEDYGMSLLITENNNNVIAPSVTSQMRSFGLPIRAVTTASGGTSVEPTSVSLPASKSVNVGESITLTATLDPSNATTTFTWSSDDTSIATVSSSGVVTGVKVGSTKVRVKTSNGKTDAYILLSRQQLQSDGTVAAVGILWQ